MITESEIHERIKAYVLDTVLPGEDSSQLTGATPLVSSGVLDSVGMLRFVSFLDEEFSISIEAQEIGIENFETIELITRFVVSKITNF